jgi:hypothetical protein
MPTDTVRSIMADAQRRREDRRLGLEPVGNHLLVDPAVPTTLEQLELLDIPGRWGRVDAFGRGRVEVDGRRRRGARVAKTTAGTR